MKNFVIVAALTQEKSSKSVTIQDISTRHAMHSRVLHYSVCKVVIYNYVVCWLYSITKSVVIALIYFLVFCGILLYWV